MDGAAGSGTHRALIAASDEDLVTGAVAFVCAGLDAGEPVVVACTDPTAELLQKGLAEPAAGRLGGVGDVYGNGPAAAITAVRRLGERHRVPGSPVVRVVLEPFAGPDRETWREWMRYDAVLDHQLEEAEALGEEPLVVLCLCDTRRVPGPLVDAARATHPLLQVDGVATVNPDHVEAAEYLTSLPVPTEPLEATTPLVRADSVRDLRGLRRDLAHRAADASLPAGSEPALEDFLLAVDEMTTNALRHGRRRRSTSARWADEEAAGVHRDRPRRRAAGPVHRLRAGARRRPVAVVAWACGWPGSSATTSTSPSPPRRRPGPAHHRPLTCPGTPATGTTSAAPATPGPATRWAGRRATGAAGEPRAPEGVVREPARSPWPRRTGRSTPAARSTPTRCSRTPGSPRPRTSATCGEDWPSWPSGSPTPPAAIRAGAATLLAAVPARWAPRRPRPHGTAWTTTG